MTSLTPINSRRLFRGTGVVGGTAASFVGLFNNAGAGELLLLWHWQLVPGTGMQVASFVNQGAAGNFGMNGVPVLAGEAGGPGQVFAGLQPAVVTYDYQAITQNQVSLSYNARPPFAVLPPGWLIGFSNKAAALGLTMSFLWQVVTPEELIGAEK